LLVAERLAVVLVFQTHLVELEVGAMDKLLVLVVEIQVHKDVLAVEEAVVEELEFFLEQRL
jgi:hypothetical protein